MISMMIKNIAWKIKLKDEDKDENKKFEKKEKE